MTSIHLDLSLLCNECENNEFLPTKKHILNDMTKKFVPKKNKTAEPTPISSIFESSGGVDKAGPFFSFLRSFLEKLRGGPLVTRAPPIFGLAVPNFKRPPRGRSWRVGVNGVGVELLYRPVMFYMGHVVHHPLIHTLQVLTSVISYYFFFILFKRTKQ